ncbi:hypothetical protein [Photobacterium arenosum]|uniref:hypothetical protein n=1 Tax=Photobacterium arenosum TaxID=2774143 RepID=UPI00288A391C|nr:hypothetical protein [Photobacterium arenosum]
MSKNSKQRREQKKKRLKKKQNKQLVNVPQKTSDSSPVFQVMDNPFAGLTPEQRKELVSTVGKESKKKVIDTLKSLEQTIRNYDPTTLISIIAGYGLVVGAGDGGVVSRDSMVGVEQAHIELLQAMILQVPKDEIGLYPVTPDVVEKVMEQLKDVSVAFAMSRMTESQVGQSDAESAVSMIQEKLRGHTQMVRNWGFHSQVKTVCRELYSSFDDLLSEKLGFSPSNVVDVFDVMIQIMEQNLSRRFEDLSQLQQVKKTSDMVLKYHELIGQGQEESVKFMREIDISRMSKMQVFAMCLAHYDLRMPDNYFVNFKELARKTELDEKVIRAIVDYFSFENGELNKEKTIFFFLDNPVWNKPIMSTDSGYYCILPQLFFSFALVTLDDLVEQFDKEGLHRRRALYLETKIESIVKRRFPESHVVSGVKWHQGENLYETDLIAFIDSHAIIIEAKSQKISKQALRGASERVKRHLKEILVEPGVQSHRLELKINELRASGGDSHDFVDKLPVDLNDINKVLRVSVSLEDFATLQSNLQLFQETGWIPDGFVACPSMNLADFETLFDFLEHPVQIIHYLLRRTELQQTHQFTGDELDYMGFYLTTLLNTGTLTVDPPMSIIITDMSKPLDLYYMSKDQGIDVEKPKPKISRWFKDIFNKLEERATPRWSEIGTVLNRFPPDEQIKMSRHIEDLSKIVQRTWRKEGHKNSLIYSPPESSEYAMAIVLFKDANRDRRYEFIENAYLMALEPEHVKYCLVIGINIDRSDLPYHYIAFTEKEEDLEQLSLC